jgi:hypothetical protein
VVGLSTLAGRSRWAWSPSVLSLIVVVAASTTASAQRSASSADEPSVEVAFQAESAAPGGTATLRFFTPARGVTLQFFHAGAERIRTKRSDVMNGIAVAPRRWLGSEQAGSRATIVIGDWESGLYFARVTSSNGLVGYAPLTIRSRHLGEHRVAVVLPTQTWQAYNFRDDNRDGRPDTWYAGNGQVVRLFRPFLDRGVPFRFRHYDLPFLHWLTRTGKHVDFLADGDLDRIGNARRLARAYDLIVFPGHHEYVTTREYDLIEGYRDLGGNLMFLSANDFFWRVVRRGSTLTRSGRWRDLGRPEATLIGVQYRANDRGQHKGSWIVRDAADAPWVFDGTGLSAGSHFGRGGIEIDATTPDSPPGIHILAEIPHIFGKRFTAQMTYYKTPTGAKVFAAGAFDLVESVLEPDAPLPDRRALRAEPAAARMLKNLWASLASP